MDSSAHRVVQKDSTSTQLLPYSKNITLLDLTSQQDHKYADYSQNRRERRDMIKRINLKKKFDKLVEACRRQRLQAQHLLQADLEYKVSLQRKILLKWHNYAIRKQNQNLEAMEQYKFSLIDNAFIQWKRHVQMTGRAARSRMLVIFNAWKLWAREQILLKKYLAEVS